METLKQVRLFYGLSQAVFAGYLGVTRSTLSMAEIGKRDLPHDAYQRFLPLEAAMLGSQELDPVRQADLPTGKMVKKQLEQMRRKLVRNRHQLAGAKRELVGMKNEYRAGHALLLKIEQLRSSPAPGNQVFVDLLEATAHERVNSNDLVAQFELEERVEVLKYKIKFVEQRLKLLEAYDDK